MDRRDAMQVLGGMLAGGALSGCDWLLSRGRAEPFVAPIVDAHCHVFNSSDLPTIRFIKIVILHHFPKQGIRTLDIRDPDALDGLIELATVILGRTRAPTGDEEIAVLAGQSAKAQNQNTAANEDKVIEVTAEFMAISPFAVASGISPNAVRTIRRSIFSAAGI